MAYNKIKNKCLSIKLYKTSLRFNKTIKVKAANLESFFI